MSRESTRRSRCAGMRPALSNTDVWLLGFIHEHENVRPTDLASWQDVDKSTITMQLKRLVAAGLVKRVASPRDRRSINVTLTVKGKAALANVHEQGIGFLADLLSTWSVEDRGELARSISRLADVMEARVAPVRDGCDAA
ncbi:MarR family winged helix-turn-helix transcriptional regulator [Dermatophilus congolensis]|nr:MarR family transcriptional regulator [Dermatophilus congolensis]